VPQGSQAPLNQVLLPRPRAQWRWTASVSAPCDVATTANLQVTRLDGRVRLPEGPPFVFYFKQRPRHSIRPQMSLHHRGALPAPVRHPQAGVIGHRFESGTTPIPAREATMTAGHEPRDGCSRPSATADRSERRSTISPPAKLPAPTTSAIENPDRLQHGGSMTTPTNGMRGSARFTGIIRRADAAWWPSCAGGSRMARFQTALQPLPRPRAFTVAGGDRPQ
jgi:hypothetical protein